MNQREPNRARRSSAGMTRRRFLGAGAGAAALLGAGTLLPAGATAAQDDAKSFHGGTSWTAPPNGHFNVFVTDAIFPPPHFYGDMIWQPFALYYWGTKEWLPLLGTEWVFIKSGSTASAAPSTTGLATVEPGADTFQITLRQGAKWSDGNEFTAKDVLATLWVQRIMSNSSGSIWTRSRRRTTTPSIST